VVTSTPPFNPNIAPCDYHPDCCWWGSEVFPKSFWINSSYNQGRDYVLIQNNGNSLQCDCDGKASISTGNTSQANWFIPEKIGGKVVALRSYYGGYLSIHADGSVDCADHTICEENNFQVILSSYDCAADAPNYVLLRVISGAYLSIANGAITSSKNVDETVIFKGYLWDSNNSICKIPVVTTPPAPAAPVCREVEIDVPVKRRHKKKAKAKKEEVEEITTTTVHRKVKKPKKEKKQCDYDEEEVCEDDHHDNDYEVIDLAKKHKKNKKAEVYDSSDVFYVDHDKESTAVITDADKCESKADDGKTYTIIDAEEKKEECH
jgi:hypothetical protein